MARPTKQGLDYFPLDIHLDSKFKFIEIKYKLEGFAIVIKLFQRIYSCGYWCKWNDDEALLFSDEIRVDLDLLQNVVNECLDREIFNKHLYKKYGILTSRGIQKRYKEIVRRRKDVEVIKEYLVIDSINGINVNKNEVNDNNAQTQCEHDDSESIQSKVNKSKGNKIKKTYMDLSIHGSPFLKIYLSHYSNYFSKEHKKVSEENLNLILDQLDKIADQIDIEEFEEMVLHHFSNLPSKNDGNILAFIPAIPRYMSYLNSEM